MLIPLAHSLHPKHQSENNFYNYLYKRWMSKKFFCLCFIDVDHQSSKIFFSLFFLKLVFPPGGVWCSQETGELPPLSVPCLLAIHWREGTCLRYLSIQLGEILKTGPFFTPFTVGHKCIQQAHENLSRLLIYYSHRFHINSLCVISCASEESMLGPSVTGDVVI